MILAWLAQEAQEAQEAQHQYILSNIKVKSVAYSEKQRSFTSYHEAFINR
jgi:hypothetical protein